MHRRKPTAPRRAATRLGPSAILINVTVDWRRRPTMTDSGHNVQGTQNGIGHWANVHQPAEGEEASH